MTRTLILHQINGHLAMVDMSKVVAVFDGEFKHAKKDRYFSKLVFQDGQDMEVKETVGQIDVMMEKANLGWRSHSRTFPNSIKQLAKNTD